jgi:hypothetical protein
MIGVAKIVLSAAFLIAVAGPAFAADPQPSSPANAPQMSYTPPPAAAPARNPDHFVKPSGYDQDRKMHPYGAGYGPKAN